MKVFVVIRNVNVSFLNWLFRTSPSGVRCLLGPAMAICAPPSGVCSLLGSAMARLHVPVWCWLSTWLVNAWLMTIDHFLPHRDWHPACRLPCSCCTSFNGFHDHDLSLFVNAQHVWVLTSLSPLSLSRFQTWLSKVPDHVITQGYTPNDNTRHCETDEFSTFSVPWKLTYWIFYGQVWIYSNFISIFPCSSIIYFLRFIYLIILLC